MCLPNLNPEHDLFLQHLRLTNTLRKLAGEGEGLARSGSYDEAVDNA